MVGRGHVSSRCEVSNSVSVPETSWLQLLRTRAKGCRRRQFASLRMGNDEAGGIQGVSMTWYEIARATNLWNPHFSSLRRTSPFLAVLVRVERGVQ